MTETKPTPPNSQSKPDSAAAEKAAAEKAKLADAEKAKAAEVEKAKAAEVEKAKAADKQEKNPSPEPQKGPGTTSNQTSNLGENSALPEPPDVTPIPTDAELNELDARHGYRPAIEAVTDNEDEVVSMRKFVQMARELPDSTPDGAVFGGFGTVRITYGDIRNIARVSQRSSND